MTPRLPRALAAGLVLLLSGAALTACTAAGVDSATAGSGAAVLPDSTVRPLVKGVPSRAVAPTLNRRLADGLVPPTNRWFSGLVFGDTPQPVFPFPVSFTQTASGFSTGLPTVTPSANTILGAAGAALEVDLGATSALVSAYDEVSVTLEHRAGDTVLGHTTIAEGSPLVSYRAASAQTIRLGAPITATGDGTATVQVGGRTWAVATSSAKLSGAAIDLGQDGTLVVFPVPDGASAAQVKSLTAAASSPLVSVATSYGRGADSQRTTLTYRTQAGGASLVVPLPHQGAKAADGCTGLTYSTVYGTVPLCAARKLSFAAPSISPASALDLSGLSADERTELGEQLKVDVATSPTFAADTYFGGKTLYRAAMLLQLARELGDTASEATLTTSLTDQLDKWTDPKGCTTREQECFVYDPDLHMMVGLATSFGSEEGNDHHFHYGYFLYAAGIVAQDDPKLAKRWAPVLDLLAADIASRPGRGTGTTFPTTRVFDPYFSHSWASGYSPFADGNNQESSSEAVTAWTGLSLWAKVSGNRALSSEAAWLLSAETASTLAYWVNPDLSDPQFSGFGHDMVSLNWGAKRDFATWFSPEPSAIIGIQLVPMAPVSTYLGSAPAGGPAQIGRLVKAAAPSGFDIPFGDYLLMYSSLAGGKQAQAALAAARELPTATIDDGNSRSYLLAYILANATS